LLNVHIQFFQGPFWDFLHVQFSVASPELKIHI
jgi:hypothetical protein